MPRRELVLCRGFRGVTSFAAWSLRKLRDRDPFAPARSLVLVPTAAASHLFRRELEDALLSRHSAAILPILETSSSFLPSLSDRLVDPLLREALLESAFARVQEKGIVPPFGLRGGLARRVLELYDEVLARSPLDGLDGKPRGLSGFFERALEELDAPDDEGAMKLAAQTRFLRASIEEYRVALEALGLLDPGTARIQLLTQPFPFERVLVLGADTIGAADLDLLARAQELSELTLAVPGPESDLPERLARLFEVVKAPEDGTEGLDALPRLLAPGRPGQEAELAFVARDREEAFTDVARLLKVLEDDGRLPPLSRIGVVVPRPLPYLYLAKKVFGEAGIPYQLQDSFPLASEPYVAAVDLVLELVASGSHRDSALALLRSPFFAFEGVTEIEVAAFDELTLRYREPGGVDRFRDLLSRLSRPPLQPNLPGIEGPDATARAIPALAALVSSSQLLSPLADAGPLAVKIDCLRRYLDKCARPLPGDDSRSRRVKAAFDSILERLEYAARSAGDPPRDFASFREKLRRAVEQQTFAARSGDSGVQIVDARSAPYGGFDLVVLLGLNEDEWPERSERNIFYPQWLLREFGFPSDRDVLAAERRRFLGLLELPVKNVVLFRHQLEEEIPAVPSPFLEDVRGALEVAPGPSLADIVVSRADSLRRGLVSSESATEARRAGLVDGPLAVSEPISPTAFELYLRCPFKYYSRYLLGLEEEDEVEETLSPLERGRILHEILQEAFAEWDRAQSAPRAVDAESYDQALAVFRRVALVKIPPEHRAIEMVRLFGGAGEPGAIPWLLRQEMARGAPRERLVEHAFSSPLRIEEGPSGEKPWYVRIQGRVDRADVDSRGLLHVYDYKSGRAPAEAVALQVPLYAMCLSSERGIPVKEAAYLSFRDRKAVSRGDFEKASELLAHAYGGIREGRFAPRPYPEHLCASCGFALVCRKEIAEPLEPVP